MSNLTTIDPRSIKINDVIRFTVKDYNDSVVYSGTVVAICDYESARAYDDVVARHQSMLAADPSMPAIENFRFVIVECYDGVRRPFGFCSGGPVVQNGGYSWFNNDKVELIDPGKEYSIKIFNSTTAEATLAIKILREHGYSCKLVN